MKKQSYQSSAPEVSLPSKDKRIPSQISGEEGLNSEPGSGVGRGLALPGEPAQAYDPDPESEVNETFKFRSKNKIDSEKLLDLFVMLGDAMDEAEEYSMANFADFMITKIAQQKEADYSSLFKDLLIKIVESDILDKDKLIVMLVGLFNRVLAVNVNSGSDIDSSKLNAYQAAVSRAEEYVR